MYNVQLIFRVNEKATIRKKTTPLFATQPYFGNNQCY